MNRLLVVGCGSIGARHARNAVSLGVSSLAVFDPDTERCDAVARETGATPYASLAEALASGPSAAVVCTPPVDHVASTRACVDAGCDVLIEKPLAASVAGIDELASAIAERGVRAAVAYQLRFHPAIARMRELVRDGVIGRLLIVRAEFGQYLPAWRPSRDYRQTYTAQAAQGGGILLDASHELDYVRWLAGDVCGVYAVAGQMSDLDIDVEDTAALVLRFAAGTIGEVHLDCVRHGYSRGCALIGTRGTIEWSVSTGLRVATADGGAREDALVPDANAPYLAELRSFLTADASAPFASLDDGRQVLEIIEAARRSASTRCEVAL